MTREKMSRPNSSVPKRCARDGASSWLVNACSTGSNGASTGAKTAAAITPATIAAPATKLLCANSRRHERAARRRGVRRTTVPAVAISLVSDAGIQIDVEHLDEQDAQDKELRCDKHHPPHHGVDPRHHACPDPPSQLSDL